MFENVPKGWKKYKLKRYIDMIRGVNYKTDDAYDTNILNTTGILRANNISNDGTLNFDKLIYVDDKNIKKEQLLIENDILIAMSSGSKDLVGKAAQLKQNYNFAFGAFCGVVRPKNVNSRLIGYFFQTDYYRNKISELSTGININNLRKDYIENLDICIPIAQNEQEEIVKVLDMASDMVRLRKECIASAQSLVPAIFQEMFGDVINNDRNIKEYKIKELGKVTTGSTPSSNKENMFGGNIPFITPADLESDNEQYQRYLTEEGSSNSRSVRAGSCMVCCIGATIGKVDIARIKSCFNQQINAVEWNNELIIDKFGLYLFRLMAPVIKANASQATLPLLNKSNFENIKIVKPSLDLQKQFAQKAQEIEEYIKQQQEELKQSENLFQSLLHHAFTGELTSHKGFNNVSRI